jgi:hypothetical protein
VEQANQSVVVAVSSILVAVFVVAGFFVTRALLGGGSAKKGKTAAEAGAAVAEAENEVSVSAGMTDMASVGSGQKPFDENRSSSITPARFEEDDGEFEDVDDYTNDQSDTSTLTEEDVSNVQIV